MDAVTTRATPTVEAYGAKYPDVPREVILKEDLLRLGVRLTPAALTAAKGCRTQAYYLFSYNISEHEEMGEGVSTAAPEDMIFRDGPYKLRRTWVRLVLNHNSPYVIDVVDGKLVICENHEPVAEAIFPSKPQYYGSAFEDGLRYEQVVPLLYDSYAFITT